MSHFLEQQVDKCCIILDSRIMLAPALSSVGFLAWSKSLPLQGLPA